MHTDLTYVEFLKYLERRLIPDLRESKSHTTADDFEDCVEIIIKLLSALDGLTKKPRPQPPTAKPAAPPKPDLPSGLWN